MQVTISYNPPGPSWEVSWPNGPLGWKRYRYFYWKWRARWFAKKLAKLSVNEVYNTEDWLSGKALVC